MRKAAIVSWGLAKFGRRSATLRDLASEAIKSLFENTPNLSNDDIDALIVSSNAPERTGQTNFASVVAELIELKNLKYITRVELACASGHNAIRAAWHAISAGYVKVALVLGVEKMWLPYREALLITDMEREWDFPHFWYGRAPAGFALCAQEHMKKYGTTKEQLAMVAIKNHKYALMNPYAQELKRRPVTVEDVINSRMIATPLNLFDCCSRVDGAAAVLMVSSELSKKYTDTPVYILGSGMYSTGLSLSTLGSYSEWVSLKIAAKQAYEMANVTPNDIDIAEVHDCFTISEIIEYEELGFCKKGEGGKFIEEGQSEIGGKVAVNPRGGLIGCGHAVGATGIAQAIEILQQMRGEVKKGISKCDVGLIQTLGGIASTASVIILGRK